jgi:hypothetical protein
MKTKVPRAIGDSKEEETTGSLVGNDHMRGKIIKKMHNHIGLQRLLVWGRGGSSFVV